MNNTLKSVFGLFFITGLGLGAMTGCAGGYVEAGGPVYYGGEPWVQTDVVVGGGGGWYGDHRDNAYVHPDAGRNDNKQAVRHDSPPARSEASPAKKPDDHHK
ncbi:MAG: hypothetical protein ABSH26_07805 [Opitutaceae bacterium]|jgi:hypothetical protein